MKIKNLKNRLKKYVEDNKDNIKLILSYSAGTCGAILGFLFYENMILKHDHISVAVEKTDIGEIGIQILKQDIFGRTVRGDNVFWNSDSETPKEIADSLLLAVNTSFDDLSSKFNWVEVKK